MLMHGDEAITFERMEEVTRELLGVTEKVPGVWHEICLTTLALTRSEHPEEAAEEEILWLTELAILDRYLKLEPPEVSAPDTN